MTKSQRIKSETFTGLNVTKGVSISNVLDTTCSVLGITKEQVRSSDRLAKIVYARHIFCYLAYNTTFNKTLKEIGKFINRDHASVIHGKLKIQTQLDLYEDVKAHVDKIKSILGAYNPEHFSNKELTFNSVGYYDTPEKVAKLKEWCKENDPVSVN